MNNPESSSSRPRRRRGVVIYTLGMLLIVALGAVVVWGDLEASLFDVSIQGEERLSSLRCPVLIGRHEVGEISASFYNSSERPVVRPVRAHISQGFVTLFREENLRLPLQPGEERRWSWTVTPEDAAYGFLILVRISALRQSPMPSQSGACGILVLDLLGVDGQTVFNLWLILGLAAMAAGMWISGAPLWASRRQGPVTMAVVSGAALALLVAGLMGYWVIGVLLLGLLVLMLVSIAAHALVGS